MPDFRDLQMNSCLTVLVIYKYYFARFWLFNLSNEVSYWCYGAPLPSERSSSAPSKPPTTDAQHPIEV